MGNISTTTPQSDSDSNHSHSERGNSGSRSKIWIFLHRTWTIIVEEKFSRTTRNPHDNQDSASDFGSSQYSQYTFCSCSQCQRDDGFSSGCASELFESGSSMAPNSEESTRIGQFPFPDDGLNSSSNKEKQRPPIYNPEDYALSLKKWGRKPPNGTQVSLYPTPSNTAINQSENECTRSHHQNYRDYRNPMLISSGCEMTLRQFGTVSELLTKLKSDLRLAYPSFVQEFAGDPLDGVTLLLDLLRAVQLSQSTGSTSSAKIPPSLQRRALLDEFSCLQCLLHCCERYSESVRKLVSSSAGLFTLSICIMSNVTKSRILALRLLTRACLHSNSLVSEALSTLRLRFGEPVRFRFLVGMLMSAGGQGELLASGMKFLNTLLESSESTQKRLYIQAELEQAGFDIASIKKNIGISSQFSEAIFVELDRWEKNFLDVETLSLRLQSVEKENDNFRDKVLLLERRVQILLEEKGILISLEQCLKDRCSELQEEVHSLKSEKSGKNSSCGSKVVESPHEDEGISSSERSLTPEKHLQRESSVYELYSVENKTLKIENTPIKADKNYEEDEEETTIDEVIEELRNIINDAETEAYREENAKKIQTRVDNYLESEIIPSNLHPQPPRRTKSLVHLFIPAEDYDYGNNNYQNPELFFENDISDESSDSLLSSSKYQLPRLEKNCVQKSESIKQTQPDQVAKSNFEYYKKKSKSLDRIDDGLDTMIDIVVEKNDKISRSVSNILGHQKKFANEKFKMFLPSKRDDVSYYFPRVQEKKSNSFLIKRGHTNAGLYSGHNHNFFSLGNKNPEFSLTISTSSCRISGNNGKLTDLPSGLY